LNFIFALKQGFNHKVLVWWMRPSYCIAATAAIFALLAASPAGAQTVRIGGTGSANALMHSLGSAYAETSEDPISVIPSLGTNGAIRAVAAGALDIAVSGRPLKPQEEAAGLVVLATLKTPFGFLSSRQNPPGLAKNDIAALFDAARTTWADGFPLRIVMRPRSESDTALIVALFPEVGAAMERARARPEIPIAATDQDNADLAERLTGSLAGATLTQIAMEKRPLSFVDIDGVKPTLENLESGAYPYAKTFYLVAARSRRPSVDRFTAFLLSASGRKALREGGVLPARDS
jgi:phosphate transport system substrate-binding protein